MPRPLRATRYKNEYKEKVSLALTSTAVQQLDEMAAAFGISRSELIERIGRKQLVIAPDAAQLGESLAS